MKKLFIMLAVSFYLCLTKSYDSRNVPSKNSIMRRNSIKSDFSFKNSNKEFPIRKHLELESVTNSASKNRRFSIVETRNTFTDSKHLTKAIKNNWLLNPLRCIGSILQVIGNFLLRRTIRQMDSGEQQLNNQKHVYIIPTAPPRLQNDKLYNRVNTKAYVTRPRGNQASRVRQPSTLLLNSVEMENDKKIVNIMRNVYSVVVHGHKLLPDKYKSKLFKMLGNISSKKTTLSKRKNSKAPGSTDTTKKRTNRTRARTTSTR